MKAAHLEEATKLIAALESIRHFRKSRLDTSHPVKMNVLVPRKGSNGQDSTQISLGADFRDWAYRKWQEDLAKREAELLRRAEQIDLKIGDVS